MNHHSNQTRFERLVLAGVFICTILIASRIYIFAPNLNGQALSTWVNASGYSHVQLGLDSQPPQKSRLGNTCVKYRFIRKFKPISLPINYPEHDDACAIATSFGYLGSDSANGLVHVWSEKYAGKLLASNSSVFYGMAGTSTIIEISNGTYPRKHMRIYNNWLAYVQPQTINGNYMSYRLPSHLQPPIKDKAGNPLNIHKSFITAAKNGRWIIAYSPNKSLLRINTENTTDILPFARRDPSHVFAISNSGRYAAVSYPGAQHELMLYDLACGAAPEEIEAGLDCDEVNLSQYLINSGAIPAVNSITRLEFYDEYHLKIVSRDSIGNYTETTVSTNDRDPNVEPRGYIAMGDSFASGEGDMDSSWYEVGTDEPENKCHLSRRSYPYLINQSLELDTFHSIACSGAVIRHVTTSSQQDEVGPPNNSLGSWLPGAKSQISFLQQEHPSIVTVSIGGNDMGFAHKLTECVIGLGTCKYAEDGKFRSDVAEEAAYLHRQLVNVYSQLITKTEGKTKIFAVSYPQLIKGKGGSCGFNVHLNDAERKFVYEGVKYTNEIIESAAHEAGIYYLDLEDALDDYNLCSDAPDSSMAVNGLTKGNDIFGLIGNESYHPNQNGHRLMANRLFEIVGNDLLNFPVCPVFGEIACPRGNGLIPAPTSYWGADASQYVKSLNLGSKEQPALNRSFTEGVVEAGKSAFITMTNLKPESILSVKLFSEPTELGQLSVDENGKVDAEVLVPADVEPGFHTIRLYGQETTGEEIEYYQHVFVPGPEGDIDNNGVLDTEQGCLFVEDSMEDKDDDSIDDACDGYINERQLFHESGEEHQRQPRESALLGENEEVAQIGYIANKVEATANEIKKEGVIDSETLSVSEHQNQVTQAQDQYKLPKMMAWLSTAFILFSIVFILKNYSLSNSK